MPLAPELELASHTPAKNGLQQGGQEERRRRPQGDATRCADEKAGGKQRHAQASVKKATPSIVPPTPNTAITAPAWNNDRPKRQPRPQSFITLICPDMNRAKVSWRRSTGTWSPIQAIDKGIKAAVAAPFKTRAQPRHRQQRGPGVDIEERGSSRESGGGCGGKQLRHRGIFVQRHRGVPTLNPRPVTSRDAGVGHERSQPPPPDSVG